MGANVVETKFCRVNVGLEATGLESEQQSRDILEFLTLTFGGMSGVIWDNPEKTAWHGDFDCRGVCGYRGNETCAARFLLENGFKDKATVRGDCPRDESST